MTTTDDDTSPREDVSDWLVLHGPAGEEVRVSRPFDRGSYILIGFTGWDYEKGVEAGLDPEGMVQLDFDSGVRLATAILSALLPGASLDGDGPGPR